MIPYENKQFSIALLSCITCYLGLQNFRFEEHLEFGYVCVGKPHKNLFSVFLLSVYKVQCVQCMWIGRFHNRILNYRVFEIPKRT